MNGKRGRKKHIQTNSHLACFLSSWVCRHSLLFKLFCIVTTSIEIIKSLSLKVSCHPSISRKKNRGNNAPKVIQWDINVSGRQLESGTLNGSWFVKIYLYFNLFAFLWSSQLFFEVSISPSRNAPLKKSSGLKFHFPELHWKERQSSYLPWW